MLYFPVLRLYSSSGTHSNHLMLLVTSLRAPRLSQSRHSRRRSGTRRPTCNTRGGRLYKSRCKRIPSRRILRRVSKLLVAAFQTTRASSLPCVARPSSIPAETSPLHSIREGFGALRPRIRPGPRHHRYPTSSRAASGPRKSSIG